MSERTVSPFIDATFTPDGSRLLTCDYSGQIIARDPETLKKLAVSHVGKYVAIYELAVTSDSRYVIAACFDGTVRVCELGRPREVRVLEGHSGPVLSVVLTPDGRHIVSGSRDGTVRVWDFASGEPVKSWSASGAVLRVAINPDGDILAVAGPKGAVLIWDFDSGRELGSLHGHDFGSQSVRFTADGRRILTGDVHGTVRVWHRESLRLERTLDLPGDPRLRASNGAMKVLATSDGSQVVVRHVDGSVAVWESDTGRLVDLAHEGCTALTLTPDSSSLFVASNELMRLVPLPVSTPEIPQEPEDVTEVRTSAGWTFDMSVAPDGQTAVLGFSDGSAHIVDLSTGRTTAQLTRTTDPLTSVVLAPDELHLVTASRVGKKVHVWDLPTNSVGVSLDARSDVRSVVVTRRGRVIAGCGDGKLRCWDLRSGTLQWTVGRSRFMPSWTSISVVTLTADDTHVVAGAGNGQILLFDAATGARVRSSSAHRGEVTALAVAPDGTQIVSVGADALVRVTDLGTGQEIAVTETGLDWVADVAVARDGARVLAVGADERVIVWNLVDDSIARHDVGHTSPITRITAVSGTDRYVTGADHALRVWDLR